jgi:sulfide dehydrogenase [flavocytochrome c] flavoprotein subunit
MAHFTRRDFIKAAGAATAFGTLGGIRLASGADTKAPATKQARILIVGGGYGGTIAAKYLRMADPKLDVTLIEREAQFVSCPMSNEVLAGDRDIASLTFNYKNLGSVHGVKVIKDDVTEINAEQHYVKGAAGKKYEYDKLIVSPGVDYAYEKIQGYNAKVAEKIPHAWKAGPQTLLLRKQLTAMKDGGVCYIVAPPNPFRCPPGPYERAAQIAHYFKQAKPKSKIIILDAKDKFSKQALFLQGYEKLYGGMIEWVGGAAGGIIESINPDTMTLVGQVQEYKGDVINLIPHQKAGALAQTSGLTDESGWCPVDQKTFASKKQKDVYVIGDACIAGAMPKSGYSANSQAKVCAVAIVAALNGQEAAEPSYVNTCYSLIGPEWGISVAAVYQLKDGKIVDVEGAGGLSPLDATPETRALEARYGRSWFKNITAEMFG